MAHIALSEFADKLSQIISEITRETTKRQRNEFFKGKITLPQYLILDDLYKEGEAKMTDIARSLDISSAAATGIVDRIVKYGYIERVYDPNDRRVIRIKLNAKGRELIQKLDGQRKQKIVEIFGRISEKEREDYLRILGHVKEISAEQYAKKA